jgi:hypothetical protein
LPSAPGSRTASRLHRHHRLRRRSHLRRHSRLQPRRRRRRPPNRRRPPSRNPRTKASRSSAPAISPNCEVAGGGGARSTALILDRYPNAVIYTTGDHAYQTGSEKEFRSCYEPTWGRFKTRTHPAVGNHDLITDKGKPYYDYFGEAAGPRNLATTATKSAPGT